jgi:isoquinoline 1-oxidoreductase beta subunit
LIPELVEGEGRPFVETHIIQGSEMPGGFGETAVLTVASAIANAIFAATGK